MLQTTWGLILRTVNYSETSVICDIYTKDLGLQGYILSGVRKAGSRMGSIVRPMFWVELVAYRQEGKDLHRIREIKPAFNYTRLPFEVLRSSIALFVTEIIQKTVRQGGADAELFAFFLETYRHLDNLPAGLPNLHLWFLVRFAEHLGFMPEDTYFEGSWFDYTEGCFLAEPPLHGHHFGQENSRLLHLLLQAAPEQLAQIALPAAQRRDLLARLLQFYTYHIDNFPLIHSHTVLQTVLQ